MWQPLHYKTFYWNSALLCCAYLYWSISHTILSGKVVSLMVSRGISPKPPKFMDLFGIPPPLWIYFNNIEYLNNRASCVLPGAPVRYKNPLLWAINFVLETEVVLQTASNIDMKHVTYPDTREFIVFYEAFKFVCRICFCSSSAKKSSYRVSTKHLMTALNVFLAKDWPTPKMSIITLNKPPCAIL